MTRSPEKLLVCSRAENALGREETASVYGVADCPLRDAANGKLYVRHEGTTAFLFWFS